MTKVYVLRRYDSYRNDERVAVFTSKRKVYGYLAALMDAGERVSVRDRDCKYWFHESDAVTVKNLMERCVIIVTSWIWTYYVEEVEVR